MLKMPQRLILAVYASFPVALLIASAAPTWFHPSDEWTVAFSAGALLMLYAGAVVAALGTAAVLLIHRMYYAIGQRTAGNAVLLLLALVGMFPFLFIFLYRV